MDETTHSMIDLAVQHAIEAGREIIPINKRKVSTRGNLRYNATNMEPTGDTSWEIYVSGDGEQGIAPYAPYTNEPWIAPRWNGKKNPNEGWWDRFVDFVVKDVAKTLGARIVTAPDDNEEEEDDG